MAMIDRYYQEELSRLKECAAHFAAAHPALAPMLGAPSSDPDVERLLEGVAFQHALLRRKLDDDFPELIHDLARLVCPQLLRPVPAATIVAFAPKASLTTAATIPAGTELASVPVEGTRCVFRTCSDVLLQPLELVDASFAHPATEPPAITLSFDFRGGPLDGWSPESVRLFLGGEYWSAASLYLLLRRHLTRIVVAAEEGGEPAVLPPSSLKEGGFAAERGARRYPANAFPAYRLLQDYFTIPQRFLFLDLAGWERWVGRGSSSRFTVRFELSPFTPPPPRVRRESFVLFAAPAVNLFCHDADPIILDHRKERYPVHPAGMRRGHVQIVSVDAVSGFARGASRERTYRPFDHFRYHCATDPLYHVTVAPSPIGSAIDIHLSFPYSGGGGGAEVETLSVALTCTNGALADRLGAGEICHTTPSAPESATFRNITPVASGIMPPLGRNLLWRLVSHLSLSRSSLASAENVRALLSLYLFEEDESAPEVSANRTRIGAIGKVMALPANRLVRGLPIPGTEIEVQLNGDDFAGGGDLFLFGSVLDHFLGAHAALNTFTALTICDTASQTKLEFPLRLGEQSLL